MLGVFITFLGKIRISQWSSDQMGESKNMCLRWFRSMCWTDERHSKSDRMMERSSGRIQIVFVLPRCSGYRWRSNWIRVENFRGFHHCPFLKKSNKTWRSGRSSQRSSKTGSSSCQCSMTLYGTRMMRIVFRMPNKVKNYGMRFSQGHWRFLGPGSEKKWCGSSSHAQKG